MRVSVVVVSRDRPDALSRCLTGLSQLYHPAFEIVVVADPAGLAAAQRHAVGPHIRIVPFAEPNISAARNAGIAASGGDIIAFIDDDAVPEPGWLDHLCAPFADPTTDATGGYVIGRNGISFQWTARQVDASGVAIALPMSGNSPQQPALRPGHAVKLEGTNMAIRRTVLSTLGGFDPAFAFYLDETDLCLRLTQEGHRTTLVPRALVHHGYAASPRRRPDRAPLTLFDIGASSRAFWQKHLPAIEHATARAGLLTEQRARLLRLMQRGTLEPRDVRRLMATLHDGLATARVPQSVDLPPPPDFMPLPSGFRPTGATVLSGGIRDGARLREQAAALRAQGRIVTALQLSRTALYHRVEFRQPGIWWQTGGIHGRSLRDSPAFIAITRADRVHREKERLCDRQGTAQNESR